MHVISEIILASHHGNSGGKQNDGAGIIIVLGIIAVIVAKFWDKHMK